MSARAPRRVAGAAALAAVLLALAPVAGPFHARLRAQTAPSGVERKSEPPRGAELFIGYGRSTSLAPLLKTDVARFHLASGWALFGRIAAYVGDRVSLGLYGGYLGTNFSATVAGSEAPGSPMPVVLLGTDAMVRLRARRHRWAPFLVAGLGTKAYEPEGEDSEWWFAWNIGGGLDFRIAPLLSVRVEGRDHMSPYHPVGRGSTLQQDLVVTAGLRIGG